MERSAVRGRRGWSVFGAVLVVLGTAVGGCGGTTAEHPVALDGSVLIPVRDCLASAGAQAASRPEEVPDVIRDELLGRLDKPRGAGNRRVIVSAYEPRRGVGWRPGPPRYLVHVGQRADIAEPLGPAGALEAGPSDAFVVYANRPPKEARTKMWRCLRRLGQRLTLPE